MAYGPVVVGEVVVAGLVVVVGGDVVVGGGGDVIRGGGGGAGGGGQGSPISAAEGGEQGRAVWGPFAGILCEEDGRHRLERRRGVGTQARDPRRLRVAVEPHELQRVVALERETTREDPEE